MRKRNNTVLLRLNDEEYNLLNCKVRGSGLSREAFLRALIKNKELRAIPPMDFFDVLRELSRIDNNMNQIAAKAHSLKYIDEVMYRENCSALEKTISKIMQQVL